MSELFIEIFTSWLELRLIVTPFARFKIVLGFKLVI